MLITGICFGFAVGVFLREIVAPLFRVVGRRRRLANSDRAAPGQGGKKVAMKPEETDQRTARHTVKVTGPPTTADGVLRPLPEMNGPEGLVLFDLLDLEPSGVRAHDPHRLVTVGAELVALEELSPSGYLRSDDGLVLFGCALERVIAPGERVRIDSRIEEA